MLRGILVLTMMLFASASQAAVWTATNTWNAQWEQAFGKFINELPLDYFNNPNMPYAGIETDCADAAYTLRTIFAYENRLPVNFANYNGRDLSNNSTQYDNVPEGRERVKRFITLVRLNTDTSTIINETYPIAINRGSIQPGTMFLHSPKGPLVPAVYHSAHVFYIQNVSSSGLVTYISSTVPVAVRNLNARFGYTFIPFNTNSGYRAWKWPNTQGQQLEDRLNGSQEQFTIGDWQADAYLPREAFQKRMEVWTAAVRERLKGGGRSFLGFKYGREINTDEEMKAVIGNISSGVNERIAVVQNGWNYYQSHYNGQGCMSAGDYDDYSTPSRDTRIQQELLYLPAAAIRYARSHGKTGSAGDLKRIYSQYRFQIMPGVTVDLNQIYAAFVNKDKVLSISEPEHSPQVRWGLTPALMKSQWACPERASQYYGSENINR